eukprot:3737691-Rhodomonas_salina.2
MVMHSDVRHQLRLYDIGHSARFRDPSPYAPATPCPVLTWDTRGGVDRETHPGQLHLEKWWGEGGCGEEAPETQAGFSA